MKKKLSKFCELVGKNYVIVRCYSSTKKKKSIYEDFVSAFGFKIPNFENNKRNVGATANAARVLLRLVKIRENYSRANFIAFRSFLRINEFIISSFAKDAPLDPNYFSCFADYSDNEYLKEEFGIEYQKPKSLVSKESCFEYLDDLNYIELKNPFFTRMTFSKNENNQEFMEQLILVLVSRNNIDLVRKTYGSPDELLFGQTSDKKSW